MALQYDTPVTSADLNASLAANPAISSSTAAAISALLGLENTETTVVAGTFNAETGAVTAPEGETPAFVSVTSTAVAGDNVTVDLNAVSDASVIVFETDANVSATLDTGTTAPVAAEAETVSLFAAVASNDKVIVGGNGNDVITVTGDANITLDGGDGNDTLITGAGNDTVNGGAGSNVISTGAGNDLIITGTGNNVIDAGTGYDTVQFAGARDDFQLTVAGSTLVLNGNAQTVNVTNAEFLSFDNNESLAVTTSAEDASVLRLYEGLLGRDADQGGAEWFVTARADGATTASLADAFLTSAEYKDIVTDSLVDDLYTSLLGRTADQGGQDYWSNAIANGLSLSQAAVDIAGSAEGQAATTTDSAFVNGLYQAALGRTADAGGLDFWTDALAAGTSRTDIASGIFTSSEATDHANVEFVNSLYTNALGRDNDANDIAGKAYWITALQDGLSQAQVAIDIVGSPDAQAHITNVVVVPGAV